PVESRTRSCSIMERSKAYNIKYINRKAASIRMIYSPKTDRYNDCFVQPSSITFNHDEDCVPTKGLSVAFGHPARNAKGQEGVQRSSTGPQKEPLAASLKQERQLSYGEMAFHLEGSLSFRGLLACPCGGRQGNRCRVRRSVPFVRRPGRRSTKPCWSARNRK